MRPSTACLVGLALAALVPGVARADLRDYLTRDGQLTARLEVTDLHRSGFGTMDGFKVTIAPDGRWAVASVIGGKATVERTGAPTKRQLAALAGQLDRAGVRSLTSAVTFKGYRSRSLTVKYGPRAAKVVLDPDAFSEAAVPKLVGTGLGVRFVRVARAVERLTAYHSWISP